MAALRAAAAQATMRFGKKPPHADYRTLRFRTYLGTLPAPPAAYDVLATRVYPRLGVTNAAELFPMDGNLDYGDCTIAAAAHAGTTFCGMVGERKIMPEAAVTALYLQLGNNQDEGLVELDVLNYWRKSGIGGETIFAFAKIDHKNHEHVKQAICTFGGVYLGFQVQENCQADFKAGKTWVPGPLTEDGHAVFATAYDAAGVTVLTWGNTQRATWDWWDDCVDEANAVLPQQADDPAFAPGFALDDLRRDLAGVASDAVQDGTAAASAPSRRKYRYTCPAGPAPIDVTDAVYDAAREVIVQPMAAATSAVENTLIVECREGHYCSYRMPPDRDADGPPANDAVEQIGAPLGTKAAADWDALRAFADPVKGIERVDKFTMFLWGGGATLATVAAGFGASSGMTWSHAGRWTFAVAVALMGLSMTCALLAMTPIWKIVNPNSPDLIRAAITTTQRYRRSWLIPSVLCFALALVVASLVQLANQRSAPPSISPSVSPRSGPGATRPADSTKSGRT